MEIIKETRLRITLTVSTLDQFTYLPSRVRENRTFDFVLFVFFFSEFHFVRWPNSNELYRTLSFDWVRKSAERSILLDSKFFCEFDFVWWPNSIELNRTKEFHWVRKPNVRCDTSGIFRCNYRHKMNIVTLQLQYNENFVSCIETFISWKQFSLIDALYIVIPTSSCRSTLRSPCSLTFYKRPPPVSDYFSFSQATTLALHLGGHLLEVQLYALFCSFPGRLVFSTRFPLQVFFS